MDDMGYLKKLSHFWLVIALAIVAVLCILLAVRIVSSMDYHHNDNDFFTFWLAGHLVTQGDSPYDTAKWVAGYHQFEIGYIPNSAFLYPLPLALLLAPLGLIPFHIAYIVWVTLIQWMILASLIILLSMDATPRSKLFFIPLLAGIALFRPTTLTLTQGQVSGLFLFTLAWIAFLWHKGKWFWGGFLLGLLVLKPNLGFIVIVLLAIWLLLKKRWTALVGTFISGTVMLIAGLIYDPVWVVQYWHVGSNKLAETFGGSPTVWGLGYLVCHSRSACTLASGGVAAVLLVLGFLWLVLPRRVDLSPLTLISLAATITLLITPYTWTYDQLLMILPVVDITLALDRAGHRFALVSTLFLGLDILVVVLLIFDTMLQVEIFNAIVPITILAFYAGFQKSWIRKNE